MAQLTTAGPFAISLMMYILLMEGGNIFTQPTNTSVNWRGSIVGSVLSWYAWKPGFHPQIYLKWGGGAHLGNWDNAKAEAQAEVQGHCVSASECRAIPEYLSSHLKKGWSKYSTLSSLSLVQNEYPMTIVNKFKTHFSGKVCYLLLPTFNSNTLVKI